jgi:glycosyltransferase involved in cell wall biosynthesis
MSDLRITPDLVPGAGAPMADFRRLTGLSIIVPAYNEAEGLPIFHTRLAQLARRLRETRGLGLEVVYVDDGSRDATAQVARTLPATDLDVQVVALSRNFGKEAALLAGLDHARMGALLFMDADGQHAPELVDRMVTDWLDGGFDVIYTAKANRDNESALRRGFGNLFYRLINWGNRHKIPADAGDFRLLSPRAAQALRQLPERNRFFKGLASWIGFRQKRIDYEPEERIAGTSNWNFLSLLALSIEGLTAFSVAPLRLASVAGLIIAATAFLYGLWIIFERIFFGIPVPGYPSVVVGLMVIGGVQLVMIGIVGEYIGKILSELKARPVYFVAEATLATRAAAEPVATPLASPPARAAE